MGTGPRYNLPALRRAAAMTYQAFQGIAEYIEEGITERQLAWRMGHLLRKAGSHKRAFRTIVAFGEQAAEPHHWPNSRVLRPGDMIKIDAGAVYNDMRGDITRTYFLGKPDQKFIKRYEAVYSAQQKAFPYYKAGNTGREVDAIARKYLQQKRLHTLFIHSLGHGVGRAIHQLPWVTCNRRGDNVLQVGQVVTNEPGVYEREWGGIRIEDMIEITKAGPKWMGQAPSKLKDVVIRI